MIENKMLNEKWFVHGYRLLELEQKEKELKKAKNLIARLRSENKCLKIEKNSLIHYGNKLLVFINKIIPVPVWAWKFENKIEI